MSRTYGLLFSPDVLLFYCKKYKYSYNNIYMATKKKTTTTTKKTADEAETTTTNDETEEQKKKRIFIERLSAFITCGFVAPIVYLITRFSLFQQSSGIVIGFWGILVFGILIGLISVLVWYYFEAMHAKYSIWKQIIQGILKVECPLIIMVLFMNLIKSNIDLFIESLYVFIGCELPAIIVNPLPKYCFENNIEGTGEIAKQIYDKIKGNTTTTTDSSSKTTTNGGTK